MQISVNFKKIVNVHLVNYLSVTNFYDLIRNKIDKQF